MFTEISLHKHLLAEITDLATLSNKPINEDPTFREKIFFTVLLNINYWTTPSEMGSHHTIYS